jgi:uncharacterized membrane protein YfcA
MTIMLSLLIGLIAGAYGGALGVGGGTVMIPAMIHVFGMTQHQAQGTSLAALLPPVFVLAVWRYYQAGNVNVPVAVFIAVGFTVGAFFGANFVQNIPDALLKKTFGILLILLGINMVLFK